MILIDVNILLDVVTQRDGFLASAVLIDQIRKKKFEAIISALTVANTWYIISTKSGEQEAKRITEKIIKGLNIIALTEKIILESFKYEMKDFEDLIQFYTAKSSNCDAIITRNIKDFKKISTEIKIQTPEEFLTEENIEWLKKSP